MGIVSLVLEMELQDGWRTTTWSKRARSAPKPSSTRRAQWLLESPAARSSPAVETNTCETSTSRCLSSTRCPVSQELASVSQKPGDHPVRHGHRPRHEPDTIFYRHYRDHRLRPLLRAEPYVPDSGFNPVYMTPLPPPGQLRPGRHHWQPDDAQRDGLLVRSCSTT